MSVVVIDAREWQNTFDFRTGASLDTDTPVSRLVKDIQKNHPYPGDLETEANTWVSEVALELIDRYDPGFAFLIYAHQFFKGRYSELSVPEWIDTVAAVKTEIDGFIKASGFLPIIVGTGDMTPFADFIDVTALDGLVLSTHGSARYAGLHDPTPDDLKRLKDMPHIERIVTRNDFVGIFPDASGNTSRVPEYTLVAQEGYMFRTVGGAHRKIWRVPAHAFRIPVFSDLAIPEDIDGIRGVIDSHIEDRRIALIVVEGLGLKDFPWQSRPCMNGRNWFYYEPADAQYLTLTTGRHQVFEHPVGYKYFEEDEENRVYPFSAYFKAEPENAIAGRYRIRSIAVGNRSMVTHIASGADISIECFARNLYNQGTMSVIRREEKMR